MVQDRVDGVFSISRHCCSFTDSGVFQKDEWRGDDLIADFEANGLAACEAGYTAWLAEKLQ